MTEPSDTPRHEGYTAADIRREVEESLQGAPGYPADYDIGGIVAAIMKRYGRVSIESIGHDAYWALVAEHDRSQAVPMPDALGEVTRAALDMLRALDTVKDSPLWDMLREESDVPTAYHGLRLAVATFAAPAEPREETTHNDMQVRCPSCGTTYEGRASAEGHEAYDPLRDEWTPDCPACGAPNLERAEA